MHRKKVLFAIFVILLLLTVVYTKFSLLSKQYADNVLSNSVSIRINNSIDTYIKDNIELLDDIAKTEYDNSGRIRMIEVDSGRINLIKNKIYSIILYEVEKQKFEYIYIPVGNLLDIKIVSGGPKLKINIVPIGKVSMDTINELYSVGINHTMHKIALSYTVEFKAAMPFEDITFKSDFEIPIYESLILGEVPQVYFK